MSEATNLTILFADIAGSTRLYDELGDACAYEKVVNCLKTMSSIVTINRGKVEDTIGDEIMCSFEDSNQALSAATAIQEAMKFETRHKLGVRVGMHSGLTGMDNGHPFGDVVNVASRMGSLARAGEIILSADTLEQLSEFNQANTRSFNRVTVKGKSKPIDTFEIIWDKGDSTSIYAGAVASTGRAAPTQSVALTLTYLEHNLELTQDGVSLSIGRSEQNKITLNTASASRNHGIITIKYGQIMYTDHSTNGSYIQTKPGNRCNDGLDFILHRDEWPVVGSGVISLGEPVDNDSPFIIKFVSSLR